jgi:tRNA threonylcarbamoyladenosine biosynthesis protein TsaE
MGESALTLAVADAAATEALGAALALALGTDSALVALRGELGSGKTTLARGLLRRLGIKDLIRSPTYTLIEPYELPGRAVFHIDLYRIGDPGELELLGMRDLLSARALVLVEWPERGGRALPAADLALDFAHVRQGRQVTLGAHSELGRTVLGRLQLPPGSTSLPEPLRSVP